MPVNWYAALVIIVILGAGSVAFARYNYTKPVVTVAPAVGQTWHAALAVDICGTVETALPASTNSSTVGLTTTGSGVLQLVPKTSAEAGNNATLGKFASEYTGFTLTSNTIKYPGTAAPLYKNGDICDKGSPDAGKKGVLRVRTWTLSTKAGKNGEVGQEVGGKYSSNPKGLKFANRQVITLGFVPANATLPKPPSSTLLAFVQAVEGTATPVTTTTTATTATTTPTTAATTTTVPATTTTTVPATTTTKPKASTTTTKPKS
ncbi:MAG TPA: hypothetical protein VGF87_00815 [Acidimicrobiales bacterium]|jgi:hypothetical protein